MKDQGLTQEQLAEALDTNQPNVSAWLNHRRPPLDMAVKIEKLTGIEVEAWVADESGRLNADDTGSHKAAS